MSLKIEKNIKSSKTQHNAIDVENLKDEMKQKKFKRVEKRSAVDPIKLFFFANKEIFCFLLLS